MLTLAEQHDPRLDPDLGAALGQLSQLIVGQSVEEAKRAKIVDEHQVSPQQPGHLPEPEGR